MKDTNFYEMILGVEKPWKVVSVELDMERQKVQVRVEMEEGSKWLTPETRIAAHIHKWTERTWRHLDTCQFETLIVAKVPSVKHADGKVEEVAVPWADRYQRLTRLMAQCVIVWLQACGNVAMVAKTMRLDWHTVDKIMKAAVERGLMKRENEVIDYTGIDEKSFRKGHTYASILNDLDNNRVWDLVAGRKTENAVALLETMDSKQRSWVRAVAMDMWPAYENAVTHLMPQADIVHDKFHISCYLNQAVDEVRKKEQRELQSQGQDTLKGTKYQWLWNQKLTLDDPKFQDLYTSNLQTSKAWRLKESFQGFWECRSEKAAWKYLTAWIKKAKHSRLAPMIKVARMLDDRIEGIMNYITHRITNAASEGMNSQVARLITNARGLRTFETLRIRVLFFLGKLNLSNV